jgi:hypothetical protein
MALHVAAGQAHETLIELFVSATRSYRAVGRPRIGLARIPYGNDCGILRFLCWLGIMEL